MKQKSGPSLAYEIQVGFPEKWVAGADEVGRGCLAGPVVAAAVILPSRVSFEDHPWLAEINDSKKLSADARERLTPLITKWAAASAVGIATVEEIDQLNIFHASHLAIQRALSSLKIRPKHILIDGKFLPRQKLVAPATAVIKGDQLCLSIAAASIIAKVWRDSYMFELDSKFPHYGFAQHKGYPTPAHQLALKKNGICEIHRRSFKTVAQLV